LKQEELEEALGEVFEMKEYFEKEGVSQMEEPVENISSELYNRIQRWMNQKLDGSRNLNGYMIRVNSDGIGLFNEGETKGYMLFGDPVNRTIGYREWDMDFDERYVIILESYKEKGKKLIQQFIDNDIKLGMFSWRSS
jgi:hypothetical protein